MCLNIPFLLFNLLGNMFIEEILMNKINMCNQKNSLNKPFFKDSKLLWNATFVYICFLATFQWSGKIILFFSSLL